MNMPELLFIVIGFISCQWSSTIAGDISTLIKLHYVISEKPSSCLNHKNQVQKKSKIFWITSHHYMKMIYYTSEKCLMISFLSLLPLSYSIFFCQYLLTGWMIQENWMSRRLKCLSEIEEHQVSTKISPSHTPNSAENKRKKQSDFISTTDEEWIG